MLFCMAWWRGGGDDDDGGDDGGDGDGDGGIDRRDPCKMQKVDFFMRNWAKLLTWIRFCSNILSR